MRTTHSSSSSTRHPPDQTPRTRHPPGPGTLRGQTDTCKHITLPQTSFAGGNKLAHNPMGIGFWCLCVMNTSTQFHTNNFYRAQRSCGKVMLLHLSVSHSVHRGVCIPAFTGTHSPSWADISQHALGQTPPPGQTYPSMHWDTPPEDGYCCGR